MNKLHESSETAINFDELDDTDGFYGRAKRKKWNDYETKKFYRILQTTGTNFTLMAKYF